MAMAEAQGNSVERLIIVSPKADDDREGPFEMATESTLRVEPTEINEGKISC